MQPISPVSSDSPYQVPSVLRYGATVLVLNEIDPHLQSWKTIRQKQGPERESDIQCCELRALINPLLELEAQTTRKDPYPFNGWLNLRKLFWFSPRPKVKEKW